MKRLIAWAAVVFVAVLGCRGAEGDRPAAGRGDLKSVAAADLPVDAAALRAGEPVSHYRIRNLLALADVHGAIGGGRGGLTVDLSAVRTLLDGSTVDPEAIYGTAFCGPYPFEGAETEYAYKRFRLAAGVRGGKATLKLGDLLRTSKNSEGWTDAGHKAYLYSSQENVVLFHAGPDGVGLEVLNPRGEVIDRVDNLVTARRLER